MRFVVHALDKPDALPRRLEVLAAHRAYLDTAPARHGVRVLLSGPMTADDGEAMLGSFFLLEAPNRAAVEAMFAEDPIATANVWAAVTMTAVSIRQNNMGGG
ncbi:MAG: YciI family protein [Rhodobacter sp.]|nr:YciI family protein [Rhodobacter sp.]